MTKSSSHLHQVYAIILTVALFFSCQLEVEYEDDCASGMCDEVTNIPERLGPCELFNISGKTQSITNERNPILGDVLATRLAQADTCPTTFRELVDLLKKTGCIHPTSTAVEPVGHLLAIDKERNAAIDSNALERFSAMGHQVPELGGIRTVTSLLCGSDPNQTILLSQEDHFTEAPVAFDPSTQEAKELQVPDSSLWEASGLKKDVQIIVLDPNGGPMINGERAGVFNFYSLEPDDRNIGTCKEQGECEPFKWWYHGHSLQFFDVDEDAKRTASFSPNKLVSENVRACGACHTQGTLLWRPNRDILYAHSGIHEPYAKKPHFDRIAKESVSLFLDQHKSLLGTRRNAAPGFSPFFFPDVTSFTKNLFALLKLHSSTTKTFWAPIFCPKDASVNRNLNFAYPTFQDDIRGYGDLRDFEGVDKPAAKELQKIPWVSEGTSSTHRLYPDVPALGLYGANEHSRHILAIQRTHWSNFSGRLHYASKSLHHASASIDFGHFLSERRCSLAKELDIEWDRLHFDNDQNLDFVSFIDSLDLLQNQQKLSDVGKKFFSNLIQLATHHADDFSKEKLADSLQSALESLGQEYKPKISFDEKKSIFINACRERKKNEPEKYWQDVYQLSLANNEKAYDLPAFKYRPMSLPVGLDFIPGDDLTPSQGHSPHITIDLDTCEFRKEPSGQ